MVGAPPESDSSARYRAYGVSITSTIPLPELPRQEDAHARISVTEVAASDDEEGEAVPPAPGDDMVVDRAAGAIRLRYPGVADFVLSAGCSRVEVRPRFEAPASTIRHLLIDYVVPSALAGQGELLLHASGVAQPAGAVLVLGPSGAGKSTLAAALARRGWPVLCDDGARLVEDGSHVSVVPSYPGLRLWPDGVAVLVAAGQSLDEVAHDSAKCRWVPDDRPAAPRGLACIIVMEDSDEIEEIEAVSAREAFTSTLDHSYRLPGSGAGVVRGHFDRIARLVKSYPFFRLSFPYDFSRLEEVAELIEAHVAGIGAPAHSL